MNSIVEGSNSLFMLAINLSVFLGFSLGIFLLCIKSHKNRANIFLGILLLAFLCFVIPTFLYSFHLLDDFPHIIKTYPLVAFLTGPLVYFYARSCTQKSFRVKPWMYIHFVPFLIGILLHLPFLMKTGAEKFAFHMHFLKTLDHQEPIWLNGIKTLFVLIYYFASLRVISHYRKNLPNAASSIDKSIHRWLILFTSVLMMRIGAVIIIALGMESNVLTLFVFFSLFIFYMAVFICLILKPEYFHRFPHQVLIPDSTEEKRQKYESSTLKATKKDNYLARVIEYVENHHPYRQAELSLTQLSEMVDIPSHYLSQTINEKLNCNFLDFINRYRIEEIKEKLIDPSLSHYTIMSLAYESGFNSKTAFYSTFKKQTGTTPSSFKKSMFKDVITS